MSLYVLMLVTIYQYVISSTEPRAQGVSTAVAVQISGYCFVSKYCTPLYYTTSLRSATLVRAFLYVAVKRCRYHAIRGSVLCTWYVSYEYGRYRAPHMVLLYSYRSTLASCGTWSHVSCHSLGISVGPPTSSTNENRCIRVACHVASRPYHTLCRVV